MQSSTGKFIAAAAAILLLASAIAGAADLRSIDVKREDDRYVLTSETYFEASQAQLYAILTDYEQFKRFSNAFVVSENREPDEQGRPQFYTRMEGCVLLFCKAYIRAGYLELQPMGDIVATADPEQSNFRFARERWQLIPEGEGTIMIYDFEMEPDFWVPPVVGPFVIKRVLRSNGASAVKKIEILALGEDPQD